MATFEPGKGGQIEPQRWPDPAPKVDAGGHPIPSGSPVVTSGISHPSSPADAEGSQEPPTTTNDFSGNSDHPRSSTGSDPATGERAFKILRHLPHETGAGLYLPVVELLDKGTGEASVRAAVAAWQESGKPPDALPGFVEPPR
jgi:hypothetical protein